MTLQVESVGDVRGSVDARMGVLTVDQAAERIGVSTRSLRRLILARKIRHLRIGSLIRIYGPDVDRFLEDSIVEVEDRNARRTTPALDEARVTSTHRPSDARGCTAAKEMAQA
jgi:excisionase family DNA binding protein